jgi:aquaporin TIP
MDASLFRRAAAEFIGTFTLIFIGGGAGIATGNDLVSVGLANGLAIGIMVTNLGHISGGHLNPAVTLGFVTTRRITPRIAGLYWGSQLLGAVCAALILRGLFPRDQYLAAVPRVSGISDGKGLVIEIVLSFFLIWTVFATAVDPRGAFKSVAGLAIGLIITIDVYMGGPWTGAAMNPARAFGPELVGNFWNAWWIYWIGPGLGGALAAGLYDWLYLRPPAPSAAAAAGSGVDEPGPGEAPG